MCPYLGGSTIGGFTVYVYLALLSSFAPQTRLWNLVGTPSCSSDTAPSGTGERERDKEWGGGGGGGGLG